MTDQERINVGIENRLTSLETKFELFMQESQQQREDMRRLWERQDAMQVKHDAEMKAMQEKQDAEMKELQKRQDEIRAEQDAKMKAMQEKQDAKMYEMNQRFYEKVDAISNQIHDTWKQTMLGVGGMIIALGALLITALR